MSGSVEVACDVESRVLDGRDRESFGALLKRQRLALGRSQEALAERARLSARAISAYERGLRRAPYRDTLRALTRALGLGGDDAATFQKAVSRRRGPRSSMPPFSAAPAASPAPETIRTNLPAQLTSFVGRHREAAEVARLAVDARLLTLEGSGGCGKTRLALQVAERVLDRFPDGVWVAELASLAEPSLVTHAVAEAVGVREESGQPLVATLVAALRPRHMLLVLDNCEHLLDACAHLAAELSCTCPGVHILATSREPLGVAGEVRRRVPSLTVPAPEPLQPVENLIQYEAVQLFVDRAAAAKPGFAIDGRNAAAVAEICWRLDGIPLAIELAAARVRAATADVIASRLDDRFRLLVGGSRAALPRHQTLRATFDWSYQLLSDVERAVVRRLAVFSGSWNLESAGAVCAGHGVAASAVPDVHVALVDKSWVVAVEHAGEGRYRLLETIRQYAAERLRESGEDDAARTRYRAWYRSLVERAEPELTGPRQVLWLDRLERDLDNIRAVLEVSADGPSGLEEGARMAAALLRLWIARGHLGEGRHLLAALLKSADSSPAFRRSAARVEALHAAAFVAYFQGDFDATRSLADEWLVAARELGDERAIWMAVDTQARAAMNRGDYPHATGLFVDSLAAMRRLGYRFGVCSGLIGLAVLARLQGEYERAVALCEECLEVSREAGDLWFVGHALSNLALIHYQQGRYGVERERFAEALALRRDLRDRTGVAWSLINLGDAELALGDVAAARSRFEESLALLRDLGDRSGSADALASLGRAAHAQGDVESARTRYVECLALRRDLGQRLAMPATLENLAGLAADEGQHSRAFTLAGAATALREALGAPPSPAEREQVERWRVPARAALGDAAADTAWADGRAMTLDRAVAYGLGESDA